MLDQPRPGTGLGRLLASRFAALSNLTSLTMAMSVAVFAVPVAVDLAINPRRAFGYLVPDVFYYLTIARNQQELGMWSFDGEHPTNGYHPLWQWLLSPLWALVEAFGAEQAIVPILVLLSVALIAAALAVLGGALAQAKRLTPLFILVVPGVTALASTPIYQPAYDRAAFQDPTTARPIFTTLWSFANGMETPLLILAFSGCLLFLVRRPKLESNAAALGLAALLLITTFARLDHVFFAGTLLLALLVPAWRRHDRDTVRRGLIAGAVFALGVLAYMLGNKLSYGVSMPISGMWKSTFPRVSFATFRSLGEMLSNPGGHRLVISACLFQLLFPSVIALAYLPLNLRLTRTAPFLELRAGRDRVDALLCWTAVAVLALGAYDTFFVLLIQTGPWYLPLSALFVSLACITTVGRLAVVQRWFAAPQRAIASLVILSVACSAYFVRAQYRQLYLADQAAFFYDEAPRIREYYEARGEQPKLVEFDDGIVTFATRFPAMSGHGLALDKEAMLAKKQGRLMGCALERGYNHVASITYVQLTEPGPLSSGDGWRSYKWIKKEERRQLKFVPEYHSPESGFAIFEVVLREPSEDEGEDEDDSDAVDEDHAADDGG